jgi:hypothetical protein
MREMLRICYEPFMEEKNKRNSVPNHSWNASNSRDAGNILMQATAKTSTTAAGMPTRAGTRQDQKPLWNSREARISRSSSMWTKEL